MIWDLLLRRSNLFLCFSVSLFLCFSVRGTRLQGRDPAGPARHAHRARAAQVSHVRAHPGPTPAVHLMADPTRQLSAASFIHTNLQFQAASLGQRANGPVAGGRWPAIKKAYATGREVEALFSFPTSEGDGEAQRHFVPAPMWHMHYWSLAGGRLAPPRNRC